MWIYPLQNFNVYGAGSQVVFSGGLYTYYFQYDSHGEERVGELHSPEPSNDEVTLTPTNTIIL